MHSNSRQEMQFGIICNGKTLQRWQAMSLRRLLELEDVSLALVLIEQDSRSKNPIRFGGLLFWLYCKLFFRPAALRKEAIAKSFAEVPRMSFNHTAPLWGAENVSEVEVEKIRGLKLDFLLNFGDGVPQGRILNVARYGVWSFRHSDEDNSWARPPFFWEIFGGEPVTQAALQTSHGVDGSIVLKKGVFRTKGSSYSQNVNMVCSEAARWPSQVCIDILNEEAPYLDSPCAPASSQVNTKPSNLEVAFFLARLGFNRLRGFLQALFRYSVWNIGVVKEPIQSFLFAGSRPKIDWFPQGWEGEFKADPFALSKPPNLHVFFENLDYHRPKGIIYTVETNGNSYVSQPKSIIELPVHMSYPYLVELQGETFLIPETNWAKEISVYRSVRFPLEWEKVGALLKNVAAIDSTVFQYEGRWWLMFTDRQRGGDANLFVWHAQDFWGPWKPHANNPVKSDVRSARPGGTPFIHDGVLYRPTQDCSKTGGGRIVINKVNQLTPTGFDEQPVVSLEPDSSGPYPKGLHTLSSAGEVTLVDGKRFEFVAVALVNNIVKGVKRVLGLRD